VTSLLERVRGLRPARTAGVLIALVAALHTARVAYFALRHSSFFGWGDDIGGFWLAKSLPFFRYLGSPIDVHRVPLLRLVSYAIFRAAPLRFEPAEAVLVACHVAGCVFLFAALQEIRKTPVNYALVAWCGVNPYLGSQLFWWTAGAARLPYILCSNAATYAYLRFRANGTRRSFVWVIACVVVSLGFFAKGILIPVYLGALELALRFGEKGHPRDGARPRTVWPLLAILGVISALYFVAWRAATPAWLREASRDPSFLFQYMALSWKVFGLGTAGFLVEDAERAAIWVYAAWSLVTIVSVVRFRAGGVAWSLGVAVISVSIYSGTSAARAHAAGPFMAISGDRYYFELAPVLVLFVAAALRGFRWESARYVVAKHALVGWTAAAAAVVVFGLLAAHSYRSTERLFENSYSDFNESKVFFDNLREGLKDTAPDADGLLPIAESDIPTGLVLFVKQPRTNAQLLWLMGVRVKGAGLRPGAYWVTRRGHVHRL
jgi:hypothetical protein